MWENTPVIIPTMSRYVHLKRCVESLKQNACTKDTDLYISVDYPPSDEYLEGYMRIREYVESIDGFRNVYIFVQDKNIGARENIHFLRERVKESNDKCFTTEDDIEYAPHTLDFINRILKLIGNKTEFLGVSCGGANMSVRSKSDKIFFIDRYSAYGFGAYLDSIEEMRSVIESGKLYNELKTSWIMRMRLFLNNPYAYVNYSHDIMREIPAMRLKGDLPRSMDFTASIYTTVYNKKVFFSRKRISRNWGYDGTGINSSKDNCSVLNKELHDINVQSLFDKDYNISDYRGKLIWGAELRNIGLKALVRAIVIVLAHVYMKPVQFERFKNSIINWKKHK